MGKYRLLLQRTEKEYVMFIIHLYVQLTIVNTNVNIMSRNCLLLMFTMILTHM